MNEMISLYDYLGKPAGKELGANVYTSASTKKVPCTIREISNPKYKGKVMLYPKWFLDEYFKVSQVDDLPF